MVPVLVTVAVIAGIVYVASFAVRGSPQLRRLLDRASPGQKPIRFEVVRGATVAAHDGKAMRGPGVLGLYRDELVFAKLRTPEVSRVKLADITDVVRIRSIDSFREAGSDDSPFGPGLTSERAGPDYMIKVEWRTGDGSDCAAWTVADADDWVASLARARP